MGDTPSAVHFHLRYRENTSSWSCKVCLNVVTYPGFVWLIRRGLDSIIEFIEPLYNWLQQFTNRYQTHCHLVQNWQNFSGLFPSSCIPKKTRRFGNWICFRPQVKVGEKTPAQLGPLEKANLNHWTPSSESFQVHIVIIFWLDTPRELFWLPTELSVIVFSLYSLGSDHSTENTSVA
jgi:hypothetical protein